MAYITKDELAGLIRKTVETNTGKKVSHVDFEIKTTRQDGGFKEEPIVTHNFVGVRVGFDDNIDLGL